MLGFVFIWGERGKSAFTSGYQNGGNRIYSIQLSVWAVVILEETFFFVLFNRTDLNRDVLVLVNFLLV